MCRRDSPRVRVICDVRLRSNTTHRVANSYINYACASSTRCGVGVPRPVKIAPPPVRRLAHKLPVEETCAHDMPRNNVHHPSNKTAPFPRNITRDSIDCTIAALNLSPCTRHTHKQSRPTASQSNPTKNDWRHSLDPNNAMNTNTTLRF